MNDALIGALLPVLAGLATGLPVMFGALRQVPRALVALERIAGQLDRVAERLERAEVVYLSAPDGNGSYQRAARHHP